MAVKTVRSGKLGKIELTLVDMNNVLHAVAKQDGGFVAQLQLEEGEDADRLWMRLHDEVAKRSVSYFGYGGAKERFLRYFPDGFASKDYIGTGAKTGTGERAYKVAAKSNLESTVTPEKAVTGSGFSEAVLQAFVDTNLLEPRFEMPRLKQLMRSPDADAFVRGAARFTLGDIKWGLNEMGKAAQPYDAAKWTVVTYLPFLWRPEAHVFLKPQVTKDYAERVGHRFFDDYQALLRPETYNSLLDL